MQTDKNRTLLVKPASRGIQTRWPVAGGCAQASGFLLHMYRLGRDELPAVSSCALLGSLGREDSAQSRAEQADVTAKFTCTLAKSTRLRSLSIWLICDVFCSTARAACARWLRDV